MIRSFSYWKPVYLAILGLLTIAEGVDVTVDLLSEGFSYKTILDLLLVPMVGGGIFYIVRTMTDELRQVRIDNERMRIDLTRFREKHQSTLIQMRAAILDQFNAWGLSPAETVVAELLMRGSSTREIAARLGKSDHTVRNQAAAIYSKSGMLGRNDLSAFFMADILGEEESEDQVDSF